MLYQTLLLIDGNSRTIVTKIYGCPLRKLPKFYPIFRCEKIVETLSFRRVLAKSIDFNISKLSKITIFYAVLSKEFDNLPLDLYLLKVMSTVLSPSFLS